MRRKSIRRDKIFDHRQAPGRQARVGVQEQQHVAGEVALLLGKALKAAGESDEALVYLEEAQKEFSAAGASDRVQQSMDAMLEIRLAQRRAQAAASAGN